MKQAFVYHWQELSTNKWYIGKRTSKGCHPNDGYICSSNIVLPLIQANPTNWKRTIIAIGDPNDISNFETLLLKKLDAANDPMSYNLCNNVPNRTGKSHSKEHSRKISEAQKGKKIPEETRRKMSEARKGRAPWNKGIQGYKTGKRIMTDEWRENISKSKKLKPTRAWLGKTRSEETKRKISETKRLKKQLQETT
jgi:hypothetical protein